VIATPNVANWSTTNWSLVIVNVERDMSFQAVVPEAQEIFGKVWIDTVSPCHLT